MTRVAARQGLKRLGRVSLRTKLLQGVGALPDTYKNFAFNTFLLFFYNQVLGYPATLASAALGIALCFDAVSDPVVGSYSDNLHSRLGRRHPLMYLSALPLATSLYFVFVPPDNLPNMAMFVWLMFFAIAVRTGMTLFLVPWTAMMAELSTDYVERTDIVKYRFALGWIGGVSFTFLTWTYIFPSSDAYTPGHLNPDGYPLFATVAAILVFFAVLITTHFTRSEIPYLQPPPDQPERFGVGRVAKEVRAAFSNRQFLIVFMVVLLMAAITGTKGAIDIYMTTYFWGFTPEDLRWFAFSIIGAIAAFLTVARINRRWEKKHIIIGAIVLATLDGVVLVNLRFLDWLPANGSTSLLLIILGVVIFSVYVLTVQGIVGPSIVADVLDRQELDTGRRQEGVFFAALSFASKFTSGFGVILGGIIIDLLAFPRGADPGTIDPDLLFRLGLVLGVIVPLVNLLPLALATRLETSPAAHAEVRRQLDERYAERQASVT
jgi:Na+/melibiose symporter-like transporter